LKSYLNFGRSKAICFVGLFCLAYQVLSAHETIHLVNRSLQASVRAGHDAVVLDSLGNNQAAWSSSRNFGTKLIDFAEVTGDKKSLTWKLDSSNQDHDEALIRFSCHELPLTAESHWKIADGDGPVEHTLTLVNKGALPITVPLQKSLCWQFSMPKSGRLEEWWVEKAAGSPSPFGLHRMAVADGFDFNVLSQPYETDQRAYSNSWQDRDPVPWITVYDAATQCGFYAGIEFTGRVSLSLSANHGLVSASLGLAEEDGVQSSFRAVIQPGERYELPTAFVGFFRGSLDDGCNQMTRWVDRALRPQTPDARYPLLNFDSWGSNMGISEASCNAMLDVCAALGIEQFQIDAGWFRAVGDWRPHPVKFPKGVSAISDRAHALGLKFGLWVGWTQGGIQPDDADPTRILNVHSPGRSDWFTQDYPPDWKPADFTGANLCLANPAAVQWCEHLLESLVRDNKLDMLEHDQQMIVDMCARTDHGHTESHGDIAYRATLGYYAVYDKLRQSYPDLMFENCVNGGRNVDFGAARRASYFSIVDSYDPLSNRQAIYDITHVMPAAMCECYVKAMPVKTIDDFRNMLRSGFMGWFSLMQDPTQWTMEQRAAAKDEFDLYKSRLRPLIRNGLVYHVTDRPNGIRWDGMEYVSPDQRQAVLFAFRGTINQSLHTFRLAGLNPKMKYRLHFQDGGTQELTSTGDRLAQEGLPVHLEAPESSQIVLISAD
jgi:hypothetical protein